MLQFIPAQSPPDVTKGPEFFFLKKCSEVNAQNQFYKTHL